MDAAKVTLKGRDNFNDPYGWVYSHKMNLYARVKDGNAAQRMLNDLINCAIAENLWSMYKNCFQVEADFGATAGISEMLLQSHEGYIEPLAALPDKWSSGTYSGLVARGNFEVGANWENGLAQKITILSKEGKEAKLSYPSITSARVLDSNGQSIDYKIEGENLISFETIKGETYSITGFKKIEKLDKPQAISLEEKSNGDLNFEWISVEGASSYNLYKAVGNTSSYEYIGNSKTTSFAYKPIDSEKNVRTTFCVTAVNESGTESDRTLTYLNPLTKDKKLNNYSYIINENNLEITIEATGSISTYRLYEKVSTSGTYTLVKESKFPLISYDSYKLNSSYAISIVSSYDDSESNLYWIDMNNTNSNIFQNKEFIPTVEAGNAVWDNNYNYSKLTDGIFGEFEGRFSSKYDSHADATIDLGGKYTLHDLKIYDYVQNGDYTNSSYVGASLEIQVYNDGKWETVVNCSSNSEINKHRINNLKGYSWLEFDLNNIEAEKIRIYISSTISTYTISIYEIECCGTKK